MRVECWFLMLWCIFFFKQKTAYEMRISDWSSDVCSSDLVWRGDDIFFRIETPDGTPGSVFETRAWSRKQKSMRVVSKERNARTLTMLDRTSTRLNSSH